LEVTDMILNVDDLRDPNGGAGDVTVEAWTPACASDVLALVARGKPSFLPYFENAPASTVICAVLRGNTTVGAVLLETVPERAEMPTDGALACLVIDPERRGQRLGTAAIVAICREFRACGFDRVIAEWVVSVTLYERLGFQVWRTRRISS
jgi:ribosomal protein S18 acetylase RimI-like enzyme